MGSGEVEQVIVPYEPEGNEAIPSEQFVTSSQERVGEASQNSVTISDETEITSREESMGSQELPAEQPTPEFPALNNEGEPRLPLVSETLEGHGQYWRSDRLDFLLRIFSVYTHSLRVL